MQITKEMIEKHKAELQAGLERAQSQVHTIRGAILACDHWLEMLTAPESPAESATGPRLATP
jgi:hypothetical protein